MKPATPLPWGKVERGNTFHRWNIHATIGGKICQMGANSPKENAAYIVHASNAYPKLVEALRSALSASKGDWQKGASWDRAASALLRALGEEA